MWSKVLLEAELIQKIDKYLHSSHWYGDMGNVVRASDFARSMIKVIPMADGRRDSKMHPNSNSKPISSLLLTRKQWVQSDMRVHVGVKCPQPAACWCHRGLPTEGTARIRECTDANSWILGHQSTTVLGYSAGTVYLVADLYCNWKAPTPGQAPVLEYH